MNVQQESCIFLLENDQSITRTVDSLCKKDSLTLYSFASWEELHETLYSRVPNCVIMSDAACQKDLSAQVSKITNDHQDLPVIVLGQRHNLTSAVVSIQAGAIDYIEKPAISGRLSSHISNLST